MLPLRLPWTLAQDRWSSDINPVLALPPNQGLLLPNVSLSSGVNIINHKLGKTQQGWILTDQQASADIYRSAPFNNLTLTLTSSADTMISLWVF